MKNQPLVCRIEGDELVIRIGVDVLVQAVEQCPKFYDDEKKPDPPFVKVADPEELLHDMVRQLLKEEEDGTTPLCLLFDQAFEDARDDGSIAFAEE